ncbi:MULTISPECIES: aromatic-ring-hydroxylating dioxygenase subunit beta [unclassified Nocardioides]|uniref:aromatic-ring-hydroxylating dioxygenase subunit beta n=1 Tax=unclassified Nocardioides TaxID=2615069 RepID=UPI00114D6C55|nr:MULTISPECIES: aromatic-ring-hydroxylating dioxygenase subunit beta [unclassified Nocardioides]TQK71881.1 3-phenylpropionate/cinnamic acid dioxygenase small subunit [Nocardioides sp. SLBN-35]WGY03923.1 aromatic-ring-hydroxylating dioxygenase subunit beta [Nocardioides sp. QY071]
MRLSALPPQFQDTSAHSFHVDADWYDELDGFRALFADDWPAAALEEWHQAQSFLAHEARLVDEGRFNDWLDLFAGDGLYWVPVTAGGGNPRTEVSHAFDDHRRLTDRVYWLRTGLAYSQLPASRTRRTITNIETVTDPDGRLVVRSSFVVHEFRAGVAKVYAGWYGHVLLPHDDGWRIRLKMVNLLDSEQYHENLTLVF